MDAGDQAAREDVTGGLYPEAPAAPEGGPVPLEDAPPAPAPAKPAAPPAAAAPSFGVVLRNVLFIAAAGAAVVVAGRRWAEAYARYRSFQAVDVTPLLAPEAAPAVAGASPESADKQPRAVVFRLEAPEAKVVLLGGSFNDFDPRDHALVRGRDGAWETTLVLPPGEYFYKFKVDGKWLLDPANPERTAPPREASVLHIQ